MIYFSINGPMTFQPDAQDGDVAALCAQSLTVLQDVTRNGVFLVDEHGVLTSAMATAVAAWPEKYRKKGEALLERLGNSNRIVRVPALESAQGSSRGCATAAGVSDSCAHDCLVVPSRCQCAGGQTLCQSKNALRLNEYSLGFPERFKEPTLVFNTGANKRFEREILSRVFRTAKWVRVVDRLIGAKAGSDAGFSVPENYRRGLLWLGECVAKYSEKGRVSDVIVVTAFPSEPGGAGRSTARWDSHVRDVFARFEEELQQKCGARVGTKLVAKHRLPHDRYLITDQIALGIGRGFDLLNDRGDLRQCSVSLLTGEEFRVLTRDYPDLSGAF